MKRYVIPPVLRQAIRENPCSMLAMSRQLGFTVKNIWYYNHSINESHWNKLRDFLGLHYLQLKAYQQDYVKNLGTNAISLPIKPVSENADLAELIGIILGDGNICRNCVKIAFDKRWPEYIPYVHSLFTKVFGLAMKTYIHPIKNVVYLYCNNQYVVQKLIELGLLRGDKILNNVGIPQWIKENKIYMGCCIRGLIDTDGNVHFCTRERRFYVGFTNLDQQLFQDFKEITLKLGYSFAKANPRNVCLYRKDHVARFIQTIQPRKAIRAGLLPRQ